MAFSPDGRWLATDSEGTARIWDVSSGKQLHTFADPDGVAALAFSPDSRWLVTASWKLRIPTVRIWDILSGKQLHTFAPEEVLKGSIDYPMAFSADIRSLAASTFPDGRLHRCTVLIWDVGSGQQLQTFDHRYGVAALAFSPDGLWLATANDRKVRIWDILSGQQLHTFAQDNYSALAFSPNGRWLACASSYNH